MTDDEKKEIYCCLNLIALQLANRSYKHAKAAVRDLMLYYSGRPMEGDYFKVTKGEEKPPEAEPDYIDCDDAPVRIYLPNHNKK